MNGFSTSEIRDDNLLNRMIDLHVKTPQLLTKANTTEGRSPPEIVLKV
jgi:hypothetical protein